MDKLLLLLLKHHAHKNPLRMSTMEFGIEAKMSQQNASRRLILLEKNGTIKRSRCEGITITEKGVRKLRLEIEELQQAFDIGLEIKGMVVSGVEEGKRFLAMSEYKKRIKNVLGFEPFPGTLNIKLTEKEKKKRSQLLALEPIIIDGFERNGKKYGDLYAYKCMVCLRNAHSSNSIEAAVVFPLRTRHGVEILEIISSKNLRKNMRLRNGSVVKITI